MRRGLIGLAILAVALLLGWGIVKLGVTYAEPVILSMIGQERAATNPALVSTLFTCLIFVPFIVAGMIGGALERRNAAALGPRAASRAGLGLIVGIAGVSVAVAYALLAGIVVPGAAGGVVPLMLLWGAAAVLLQTSAEEIFYRGWLQPALADRWGLPAAVLAGALVFAVAHVLGGGAALAPIPLLNMVLGGIMFGVLAAWGRGLAAVLGLHFAWNATEQLLYGVDPNPGVGEFGALIDRDLRGAAIWGGSEQGLNASIGMTLALVAILIPLIVLTWRRAAQTPPVPAAAVLGATTQPG